MVKARQNVIYILGGSLVNQAGVWRTTNYDEGDNYGLSGDRLRVLAAAYLYKKNKNLFFIASGGRGQLKKIPNSPPVAKIIKQELIALNVPTASIAVEKKSANTYEQLKALLTIIKKTKIKEISIISNQHHFPRIKAMLAMAPGLKKLNNLNIKFISAEDIVIKYGGEKFKKIIDRAKRSREMKKRIKLEQAGIKQIKQGTYKYEN